MPVEDVLIACSYKGDYSGWTGVSLMKLMHEKGINVKLCFLKSEQVTVVVCNENIDNGSLFQQVPIHHIHPLPLYQGEDEEDGDFRDSNLVHAAIYEMSRRPCSVSSQLFRGTLNHQQIVLQSRILSVTMAFQRICLEFLNQQKPTMPLAVKQQFLLMFKDSLRYICDQYDQLLECTIRRLEFDFLSQPSLWATIHEMKGYTLGMMSVVTILALNDENEIDYCFHKMRLAVGISYDRLVWKSSLSLGATIFTHNQMTRGQEPVNSPLENSKAALSMRSILPHDTESISESGICQHRSAEDSMSPKSFQNIAEKRSSGQDSSNKHFDTGLSCEICGKTFTRRSNC
jgi:hypothetical protein